MIAKIGLTYVNERVELQCAGLLSVQFYVARVRRLLI